MCQEAVVNETGVIHRLLRIGDQNAKLVSYRGGKRMMLYVVRINVTVATTVRTSDI